MSFENKKIKTKLWFHTNSFIESNLLKPLIEFQAF